MLINVVHDLDLLRHLCGEVAEIQAMQSSHARGLEVEDTVSLNLRFESGVVGSFLASDAGVSPWGWDQATEETLAFPFVPDGVAYRFVGTRGALSVPNLAKYSYDPSVSPTGTPRCRAPTFRSRRGGRSRRSSTTSSRSREATRSRSSRPRMHRARSRSSRRRPWPPAPARRSTSRDSAPTPRRPRVMTGRASWSGDDGRDEFDAIVVGGGLAGLAATQRLAASGLSVALVEKRHRLGGSSAMSGGWFALSGTAIQRRAGVEDSDDLFVADMVETGGGFADERAAARASSSAKRTRSPRSNARRRGRTSSRSARG